MKLDRTTVLNIVSKLPLQAPIRTVAVMLIAGVPDQTFADLGAAIDRGREVIARDGSARELLAALGASADFVKVLADGQTDPTAN